MTIQVGFGGVKENIDAAKNRGSNGFGGPRLGFISWKGGDRKVVRFLTDDVITALFHSFILSNDGKTKNFLLNGEPGGPEDWVAKYASPTPGLGWQLNWRTKQPEERNPRKQSVAVAVLRDRVPRESGPGFDVVDVFDDLELGNKTYKQRVFGIIQQGNNFWRPLLGYHNNYGTICDRDYIIEREGDGLDTQYTIVPCDPVPELTDLSVVQELYGYGREWPRNPYKDDKGNEVANPDSALVSAYEERFLFCPQTLKDWADQMSSEDRAKHFLGSANGNGGGLIKPSSYAGGSADEAQAAPVQATSGTDFASLRDRLLPHAAAK